MNKLYTIAMLFTTSFVTAMELAITQKESTDFLRHLGMAVGFGNQLIEQNDLHRNNPIQFIINKMATDLKGCDGNLQTMIRSQGLCSRIEAYRSVDRNQAIRFALDQVRSGGGDVEEAKSYIIRTRRMLSGFELTKLQPDYSGAWIGELQTNKRLEFMRRNANYPMDENAVKDYIAMFIYQTLFSVQIP